MEYGYEGRGFKWSGMIMCQMSNVDVRQLHSHCVWFLYYQQEISHNGVKTSANVCPLNLSMTTAINVAWVPVAQKQMHLISIEIRVGE